jgi:hypothetical protein
MSSDQLIPIKQIAKAVGTDKIHLAYLTKLRLIPQTIRRKVNGQIMGCYPEYVIGLIQKIETLKNKGLTYSQIRFELGNTKAVANPNPVFLHDYATLPNNPMTPANPLIFLVIGLVLGYVLFSLNTINSAIASKNIAASALPAQTSVVSTDPAAAGQVYLIAIPNKNLYKLGQTNLTTLLK